MKNTKYAVMIVVAKVMWKYDQLYCYGSQKKMLELLEKHHDIKIGRRQLNYHLADLRREGLLKTWKRHHRDKKGKIHLRTSANSLTIKGCIYLIRMGVTRAAIHLKALQEKFLRKVPVLSRKSAKTNIPAKNQKEMEGRDPYTMELERKFGLGPGQLIIN